MHEPGTKFFRAQFEIPLIARPCLLGPPSAVVAPGTCDGGDLVRLSFHEDANRHTLLALDLGLERRTKDAQCCLLLLRLSFMLCDSCMRMKWTHAKCVGSMRVQQFGRTYAIVSDKTAKSSQRELKTLGSEPARQKQSPLSKARRRCFCGNP